MLKKNLAILDTNVIIRFLIGDDPVDYKKSVQIFSDIDIGKIKAVILDAVLAESVYVLIKIYKITKDKVVEKLSAIVQNKNILINDKPSMIKALIYFNQSNLDFIDCLVKAYSEYNNLELLSFDKKLVRSQS
jgi:predicted nucleic-acid-binding protein